MMKKEYVRMNDDIVIRTYQPGDPSRVCYFQYKLYEEQYHFNGLYEKEMLSGMAELYDEPEGSQMWIAERDGQIVGDIAVIKRADDKAQMRWFGVALDLQGKGLGSQLLKIAMQFCVEKGYRHITLGTLDILKPAHHLYEKYGFRKTESEPYNDWDESRDMYHETWEYDISKEKLSLL
ncbi:GNAT family N-acetyltransferase [Selenomonas artemidis]|jgi:transcriptional regulator|uniref:GNAT family N-acetyltransferase n=1 Tax=Selenomonas artemidis TaxID=671224 RepID=UPI0023F217AD|nr:GNAT family N-acetyltransferase [Selenomonas artemidis]